MIKRIYQPMDLGEDGRVVRPLPVAFTDRDAAERVAASINIGHDHATQELWVCDTTDEWVTIQHNETRERALRKLTNEEKAALGLI
jgi:hypothetical protein